MVKHNKCRVISSLPSSTVLGPVHGVHERPQRFHVAASSPFRSGRDGETQQCRAQRAFQGLAELSPGLSPARREEERAAGDSKKPAPTVGIAVDHKRKNKNLESLQANVARLTTYKAKLVVFPRRSRKVRVTDTCVYGY